MRRVLHLVCAIAVLAGLSGCATNEYTVSEAQRDLVSSGLTQTQAKCVLDGLTARLSARYVKLNNQEKVDRVNPDAVALYVRNVFASQDNARNDDKAFAKSLVAGCRG
jgi:hypothetical protein